MGDEHLHPTAGVAGPDCRAETLDAGAAGPGQQQSPPVGVRLLVSPVDRAVPMEVVEVCYVGMVRARGSVSDQIHAVVRGGRVEQFRLTEVGPVHLDLSLIHISEPTRRTPIS